MKWIRWDGDCCFDFTNDKPKSTTEEDYEAYLFEDLVDCEKHAEWREIEFGTLDTETGKFKLVLKPVVPKQPTVLEAAKNLINSNFYGMNEVQYAAITELHRAVHREEANPTKPSKYDEKLVDEFLDAIVGRNGTGTQFDLRWFFGSRSNMVETGSERLYDAFQPLLKQRKAAT